MEGYRRNKHYLTKLINDFSSKIVFLQEIWLAYSDFRILQNDFPTLNFQISTPDMFMNAEDKIGSQGQVWHGAGIAWHDDLNSLVTPLQSNYERFTAVKINLGNLKLIAVSLYAPTSGKDDEYLECLSYLADFLTKNKTTTDLIIIGADWNCSVKFTPRRKSSLSDFCNTFNLSIHSSNLPTFHHNNLTSESCIDYFLGSADELLKFDGIQQLCTLDNPENLSSHDPLLSSVHVLVNNIESHKPTYTNTYTEFDRKRVV